MSLRIRRGTEQERTGRTFDLGEIIWTTNGEKLYVGDGVTPGGKNIAAQLAGTNLEFNATTGTLGVTGLTTDLVTEGLNNKYFSVEAAQDAIGAAIAAGSQSGISVVYNDNGAGPASINFTVTGGGGDSGLTDIVLDTSPSLGGNLDLNGRNLFGTGSIDIEGNFAVTGEINGSTLTLTTGLGAGIDLNGNDISGTGDIRIGGDFTGTNVSITGTISAINGLGASLNLNSRDIIGFGGINIVGEIAATSFTGDVNGSVFDASLELIIDNVTGAVYTSSIVSRIPELTIGTDADKTNLLIYGDETSGNGAIKIITQLTGAPGLAQQGPIMRFSAVDGTISEPEVVGLGDSLGSVQFGGYINQGSEGAASADLAAIKAVVVDAGDLLTEYAKAKIQLFVANGDNPNNAAVAEFSNLGILSAPVMMPGSFTSTERDALTPAVGMMIYNTTDNKFQGYQNTGGTTLEWVNLS